MQDLSNDVDKIDRATLKIYYTALELDGTPGKDGRCNRPGDINERTLCLYRWDEDQQKWIKLRNNLVWVNSVGVDTNNVKPMDTEYEGYVWADVGHLSLYALAGKIRPRLEPGPPGPVGPPTASEIEKMTPAEAAAALEKMTVQESVRILKKLSTEKASAVLEELTTQWLVEIVQAMEEEWLLKMLPLLTADKLYDIPPEVLFKCLPNAPTEHLVGEVPPQPPPDLPPGVVEYQTPTGERYIGIKTIAGEWVVMMATPAPITGLLAKVGADLDEVATTLEILPAMPADIINELPSGQLAHTYFELACDNIEPDDFLAGHLSFNIEKSWLEENNIHKWSVALYRYDQELETWISLPTKRVSEDEVQVSYTAVIPEFSVFTISGSETVAPPRFSVSDLTVKATQVQTSEHVEVSASVNNRSTEAGTYVATLWLDGTVEAVDTVTLEAGETGQVTFVVVIDNSGTYEVRVDRQSTYITVLPGAVFRIDRLDISAEEVEIGEVVAVSTEVANIGEAEGTLDIALEVNGEVVTTEKVFLEAGKSGVVDFTIAENTPGVYQVVVGGQETSYRVLRPAAFETSNLTVSPSEVKVGEEISISAVVTNTGGSEGSYTSVLKINGTEEARKQLTLGAGVSETVTFTIAKNVEGNYTFDINGEVGQFTVIAPAPPEVVEAPVEDISLEPTTNWSLIVGIIIGGIIVIGLLIFLIVRRKQGI